MKLLKLMCAVPFLVACSESAEQNHEASQTSSVMPAEHIQTAERLRDSGLQSDLAWEIVEDLTTEVGPRMPGTEADLRGVAWMKQRFEDLGFDRVYLEPVTYPLWERQSESARIIAPNDQVVRVTALGGSVGTDGELRGEVVFFESIDELAQADRSLVEGKIAYISKRMEKTIDGAGYGPVVAGRSAGARVAGEKGAIAVVIRSVGTDSDRFPHTGMMRYDESIPKIPAAALSNPDADQLERLLERGAVELGLSLDVGFTGEFQSHNVIAEVTGSRWPEEIVLIGGHLDSWDLGTGALDDGAGVAVTTAAAAMLLNEDSRPGRTVRVVAFANEEQGLIGAYHYAEAHGDDLANHFVGSESDFGAGRVWRFDTGVSEDLLPQYEDAFKVIQPLGIIRGGLESGGGPDIIPMKNLGMQTFRLSQDGTDYFDYHHTENDTLDKIDPEALKQNLAAWVSMVYLTSHMER